MSPPKDRPFINKKFPELNILAEKGVQAKEIGLLNVVAHELRFRKSSSSKELLRKIEYFLSNPSQDQKEMDSAGVPPPIKYSNEQLDIITGPASARLLVEAGPGTGKTEVLVARVAHLISEKHLPASSILLMSFTRSAVTEMKSRVSNRCDGKDVAFLNAMTMDSLMFRIGKDLGRDTQSLFESFEGNVEAALTALRAGNPHVSQFFSSLRHVIIDEAQDVLGERADFTCALIGLLGATCGMTVAGDPLQSIYGFTIEDDELKDDEVVPPPTRLWSSLVGSDMSFERKRLGAIYRVAPGPLRTHFETIRPLVPENGKADNSTYTALKKAIEEGKQPVTEQDLAGQANLFGKLVKPSDMVLFRFKFQSLLAAHKTERVCRLRFSEYPPVIFPWLACLFHDRDIEKAPFISKSDFNSLWVERIEQLDDRYALLRCGHSADSAWSILEILAPKLEGHVDLIKIRTLASRSKPPLELTMPDFGIDGPVFGTIHSAKGRESSGVHLFLPDHNDPYHDERRGNPEEQIAEECRVLYVGATRPRERFYVGNTVFNHREIPRRLMSFRNGRKAMTAGRYRKTSLFRIQVGLRNDFQTHDIVARERIGNESAEELQMALVEWSAEIMSTGKLLPFRMTKIQQQDNDIYHVVLQNRVLMRSTSSFSEELRSAVRKVGQNIRRDTFPPDVIEHGYFFGVRTVALPPDSDELGLLSKPFSKSGFYLAPLLSGYPRIKVGVRE